MWCRFDIFLERAFLRLLILYGKFGLEGTKLSIEEIEYFSDELFI